MHFFLTFTCNQKMHFGVCNIKNWIDGREWTKNIPEWHTFSALEEKEFVNAMNQAAGPLLNRNWLEVRTYFLKYIFGSETSPYHPANSIFARDEYQSDKGNLPHIHMMLSLKLEEMSIDQRSRIDNLIRASIGNIVYEHEVQHLIDDGIFKNKKIGMKCLMSPV